MRPPPDSSTHPWQPRHLPQELSNRWTEGVATRGKSSVGLHSNHDFRWRVSHLVFVIAAHHEGEEYRRPSGICTVAWEDRGRVRNPREYTPPPPSPSPPSRNRGSTEDPPKLCPV